MIYGNNIYKKHLSSPYLYPGNVMHGYVFPIQITWMDGLYEKGNAFSIFSLREG